jgi:hypothetical protein
VTEALLDFGSRQRLAHLFPSEVGPGAGVKVPKILRALAIRCKWLSRSCTDEDATAWDSKIAESSKSVIVGAHVVRTPLLHAQNAT